MANALGNMIPVDAERDTGVLFNNSSGPELVRSPSQSSTSSSVSGHFRLPHTNSLSSSISFDTSPAYPTPQYPHDSYHMAPAPPYGQPFPPQPHPPRAAHSLSLPVGYAPPGHPHPEPFRSQSVSIPLSHGHGPQRPATNPQEILKKLAALRRQMSSATQADVVMGLMEFTGIVEREPHAAVLAYSSGLLQPIVRLVEGADQFPRVLALKALEVVTGTGSHEVCIGLAGAGVLPALEPLLTPPFQSVEQTGNAEQALGLLTHLARNEQLRMSITVSGLMEQLMNLLDRRLPAAVVIQCCRVMQLLVSSEEWVADDLVTRCGLLSRLSHLLEPSGLEKGVRESALEVMRLAATYPSINVKVEQVTNLPLTTLIQIASDVHVVAFILHKITDLKFDWDPEGPIPRSPRAAGMSVFQPAPTEAFGSTPAPGEEVPPPSTDSAAMDAEQAYIPAGSAHVKAPTSSPLAGSASTSSPPAGNAPTSCPPAGNPPTSSPPTGNAPTSSPSAGNAPTSPPPGDAPTSSPPARNAPTSSSSPQPVDQQLLDSISCAFTTSSSSANLSPPFAPPPTDTDVQYPLIAGLQQLSIDDASQAAATQSDQQNGSFGGMGSPATLDTGSKGSPATQDAGSKGSPATQDTNHPDQSLLRHRAAVSGVTPSSTKAAVASREAYSGVIELRNQGDQARSEASSHPLSPAQPGSIGSIQAGSTGSIHAGSTGSIHAGSTGSIHAGHTGSIHAGSTGSIHAGSTGAGSLSARAGNSTANPFRAANATGQQLLSAVPVGQQMSGHDASATQESFEKCPSFSVYLEPQGGARRSMDAHRTGNGKALAMDGYPTGGLHQSGSSMHSSRDSLTQREAVAPVAARNTGQSMGVRGSLHTPLPLSHDIAPPSPASSASSHSTHTSGSTQRSAAQPQQQGVHARDASRLHTPLGEPLTLSQEAPLTDKPLAAKSQMSWSNFVEQPRVSIAASHTELPDPVRGSQSLDAELEQFLSVASLSHMLQGPSSNSQALQRQSSNGSLSKGPAGIPVSRQSSSDVASLSSRSSMIHSPTQAGPGHQRRESANNLSSLQSYEPARDAAHGPQSHTSEMSLQKRVEVLEQQRAQQHEDLQTSSMTETIRNLTNADKGNRVPQEADRLYLRESNGMAPGPARYSERARNVAPGEGALSYQPPKDPYHSAGGEGSARDSAMGMDQVRAAPEPPVVIVGEPLSRHPSTQPPPMDSSEKVLVLGQPPPATEREDGSAVHYQAQPRVLTAAETESMVVAKHMQALREQLDKVPHGPPPPDTQYSHAASPAPKSRGLKGIFGGRKSANPKYPPPHAHTHMPPVAPSPPSNTASATSAASASSSLERAHMQQHATSAGSAHTGARHAVMDSEEGDIITSQHADHILNRGARGASLSYTPISTGDSYSSVNSGSTGVTSRGGYDVQETGGSATSSKGSLMKKMFKNALIFTPEF